MSRLTIATRRSPLALWQAEFVAAELRAAHDDAIEVELLPLSTRGDELLDRSLAAIGGKGLFLKELEQALLDGRADLAVHSMKDVPTELPDGLSIPALLSRHDPRDALVSQAPPSVRQSLDQLPFGASVGTSSLRRQAQLLARRPDLTISTLRGNVNSRLAKLDNGNYDAIILAAAGLERLGMAERITQYLPVDQIVPAVTQGVIGVECRSDDRATLALLEPLNDPASTIAASAERAFSAGLGGNCQVPVAGFAEISGGELVLTGLVARPDGGEIIRGAVAGTIDQAGRLGQSLSDRLIARGARRILDTL